MVEPQNGQLVNSIPGMLHHISSQSVSRGFASRVPFEIKRNRPFKKHNNKTFF